MNNLTNIAHLHIHPHKTYMATSTQKLVAGTTLCAFVKHKTAVAQVHVQPQPDATASARYNSLSQIQQPENPVRNTYLAYHLVRQ